MKSNSRNCIPAALSAAAVSLILIVGSPVAAADSSAAKPKGLINAPSRAANSELPDHARADTGMTGQLDAGAFNARKLRLTLSDGREVVVRLQRVVNDDAAGQQSWAGTVDAEPGSMFVMTRYRGVTTGFLTLGSETWELMPAPGGKYLLYQVDEDEFSDSEPDGVMENVDFDASAVDDFGTGGSVDAANDGYVQDLLVAYTTAAREASGRDTLEAQIQNAVVAANQAYQNSGINITVNLVGMREVAYAETDLRTALYDLRGTSDGKMDNVHSIRDNLGADLVSLVTNGGSGCGIGFVMSSESTSFASSAFNVVKKSCFSNHSLAHELGHNQGNRHDRDSASGSGAFAYSYGFRRCASDGTGFRTVMSYPCSGAARVTQFSNPGVNYNGYATGIAYESDPANSAENARSMNNTADTIAAFRGGSGGATETAPAAPSSLSSTADTSSRVTVSWADRSDNETGFRLERSGNGVDFAEIARLGSNTTAYSDSGLAANTTYYYRVRAYNSVGNSPYSNTGSAATPGPDEPPPADPYGVSAANNGDGSATVSWTDASSNETGFEIRREKWNDRKSRWGSATNIGPVGANATRIIDNSGSGTFRYSVRALNASGASGYAGPAQVTVSGGQKGNKGGGGKGKGGGRK
jgi:hypothetical protein